MASDPSRSTVPTNASPSPNAQEHADLLKIQSLYKAEFAAETNVLKHGGADKLPADIRRRTTGAYQVELLDDFKSARKRGERLTVGGRLLGIAMGKWDPSKVSFQSCEDYRGVKSVDRDGKPVKQKPGVLAVQKFTAVRRDGSWRFSSVKPTVVKSFRGTPCDGTWYS